MKYGFSGDTGFVIESEAIGDELDEVETQRARSGAHRCRRYRRLDPFRVRAAAPHGMDPFLASLTTHSPALEKHMAATRPYFLVFKGEQHIIDAPSAAHAVQHVVGADVADLRPARAAEVSAWVRSGKPIPVAGEKTLVTAKIETTVGVATESESGHLVLAGAGAVVGFDQDGFDERDALAWVQEQQGFTESVTACQAWGRISSTKRMTLEDFDEIRTAAPMFGDACAYASTGNPPTDVEQIRASLEENPMSIDDLVEAIGEAKRRDLYITGESAPE